MKNMNSMNVKKLTSTLKNNPLLIAFLLLGVVAFFFHGKSEETKQPPEQTNIPDMKSADTFIPNGFVLVPIEIANAESLSSLVGDVGGVVDLYLATTERQKGGLKVGSRLKLLRAPLNPEKYAALVRDAESSRLLQHAGPFIAVVQNPEAQGSQLSSSGPSRVKIDYQN